MEQSKNIATAIKWVKLALKNGFIIMVSLCQQTYNLIGY